jgi:hypothetical protein
MTAKLGKEIMESEDLAESINKHRHKIHVTTKLVILFKGHCAKKIKL